MIRIKQIDADLKELRERRKKRTCVVMEEKKTRRVMQHSYDKQKKRHQTYYIDIPVDASKSEVMGIVKAEMAKRGMVRGSGIGDRDSGKDKEIAPDKKSDAKK